MSGVVWLGFSRQADAELITVTLDYSVPLADSIGMRFVNSESMEGLRTNVATMVKEEAKNEDNDGNGTITITSIMHNTENLNLVIQGVMLDVSDASGTVTVTVKVASSDATDFIRIVGPSSATVIENILVGVEAEAEVKPVVVRTRGTDAEGITASLTLKESFTGAFMMENMLKVEFSGIPEKAKLTAVVAEPTTIEGGVATTVTVAKNGDATVTLGGTPDDAEMDMLQAHDTVELKLTLTANSDDDDISFPLDVGSIMAKVTFTGEVFTDAFTDYVTVFNIRPAQCELLFPVVTVLGAWDTALSITNPAYGEETASGGLMFTFYGIGSPPVVAMYDTTDMITGIGLADDGTLAPGGTYQVMSSQILAATDWGETFQGHVHLRADYTNCSGSGWVTDFMGTSQAYTATVIDNDTGDESN